MRLANCVVIDCTNNTKKLLYVKRSNYTEHDSQPQSKGTRVSCNQQQYCLIPS